MEELVNKSQKRITKELEKIDNKKFKIDIWKREKGGGGKTMVLEDGDVFEKAGVNTSIVHGTLSGKEVALFKSMLKTKQLTYKTIEGSEFYATGISIVIHPKNPFVPIIHANYRYFELKNKKEFIYWVGGGCDLTPCYYFEEDESEFHENYKLICDKYNEGCYEKYKENCDRYFYLPHRNEYRGIGGIFFDYLTDSDTKKLLGFIDQLSSSFPDIYLRIVQRRKDSHYTEEHKTWQNIRRGRYAEFNLIYDKGTSFGLKTGGRTESILMSLPPNNSWKYNYKPQKDSLEEKLINRLSIK